MVTHAKSSVHNLSEVGNAHVAISARGPAMTGVVSVGPPVRRQLAGLRCRTVARGEFKQLNYVRGLPPLLVEELFGSSGDMPSASPSEMLLAVLGSCLSAHILANAASASIVVRRLELDVEADMAASPMWDARGQNPSAIGFEVIRVAVHMEADASPEALRMLIANAVLWSPVASTLYGPVHLDVTLDGSAAAPA